MNKSALPFAVVAIALASCSHSSNLSLPQVVPAGAVAPKPLATSGYETLYRFGAYPHDGNTPTTDLVLFSNLLWGTTYGGGKAYGVCKRGCGTVYWINPYDPSGSNGYKMVYSFKGGSDGAIPEGGLNPNGNGDSGTLLYGTTFLGGQKGSDCYVGRGCGTVFSIDTSGTSGSQVEHVLYSFAGSPDGSNPSGGRHYIGGKIQQFYGTTQYGGANGFGAVYSVSASGQETVIYSFKGGPGDGAYPVGDLATRSCKPSACTLYGVTREGGATNVGTIFEIDIPGTEKPLYSFGSSKGDEPVGLSFAADASTLYGAASRDGLNNRGSIFAFSLSTKQLSIVHSFSGAAGGYDGSLPFAQPSYYAKGIYGKALYGTTQGGGKRGGDGTVYRITLSNYRECVIHSFGLTTSDGVRPDAPLREFKTPIATLYGTTAEGPPQGSSNKGYGTVFKISPDAPPETAHGVPLCFDPSGHRAR
jgi:uncharacterized repeat protein (TIGR03803 family)